MTLAGNKDIFGGASTSRWPSKSAPSGQFRASQRFPHECPWVLATVAQPVRSLDAASGSGHRGAVITEDDVSRICLALPGVTERLSWGRPAWFARTLMARMWDEGVLTVKTH